MVRKSLVIVVIASYGESAVVELKKSRAFLLH